MNPVDDLVRPVPGNSGPRHSRSARRRPPFWLLWLSILLIALLVAGVTYGRDLADGPADEGLPAQISVAGDRIMRGDTPWWFVGYNSFTWSGDCGTAGELMNVQDLDSWFTSMRHDGHGAVRLFYFPGFKVDRLDVAVAAARRNNIYLMVTLDNGIEGCGREAKDEAWFDDPGQQEAYAAHLRSVVSRYRGDPTIAWFEYLNEPSWGNGRLRTFLDRAGEEARKIDPTRLFSSGTIAPYAVGGEANFRTIQSSPAVDISSLHEYDFDEGESNHGPSTRLSSAGKPIVVGEMGTVRPEDERRSSCDSKDDVAGRIERKVDAYLSTPGYVGVLAWAWQPDRQDGSCDAGLYTDPAAQEALRVAER